MWPNASIMRDEQNRTGCVGESNLTPYCAKFICFLFLTFINVLELLMCVYVQPRHVTIMWLITAAHR